MGLTMEADPARDKYSERLEAVLGRSPRAEAFVAAGSIATAALLAAMPLPAEVRAAGLAWIAAWALHALRRLRHGKHLSIDARGEIAVDGAPGSFAEGGFVAPWLTVVRWLPAGAWFARTVLVLPDMLPAEEHRRLRVLLRFASPETKRAGP